MKDGTPNEKARVGQDEGLAFGSINDNQNIIKGAKDSSLLLGALAYAYSGIPVFPCNNLKRPLTGHGFKDATTNEDIIRECWSKNPDAWLGIPTGKASGLLALDIDVKNNAGGEESLRKMVEKHGQLPLTRVVQTQSGGYHYYFKHVPGVRNSAGKIAPGIDIRAEGGYIIAPPSHGYSFIACSEETLVADAPEWLVQLAAPKPVPVPEIVITDERQYPVGDGIERARKYLAKMPAAVSGSGGHAATYAAAVAMVHWFELSESDALGLMLSDYNHKCYPPWTKKELAHKVSDAAKNPHDKPKGYLLNASLNKQMSVTVSLDVQTEAERHLGKPLAECDIKHAAIVVGVLDYLRHRSVYVDALGALRWSDSHGRSSIDTSVMCAELSFKLRTDGQQVDTGRVSETAQVIFTRDAEARRQKIYSDIIRRPALELGKAEVRKWVRAVSGTGREADVQAVLHWLWLVKNRAAGRPGKEHLMLILFGSQQGSGKSTAMAKLCAVWQELFDGDISLETITDDRSAPHLAKCVVGGWDELGGLARADMEKLKHRVTAPTVGYRPMRSNDRVTLPALMTLIGTSNRSVAELVKDGTGMRRFYELPVPVKCDWETLNAIDYERLWSAISEDDDAPGIVHRDLLEAEQSKLTWRHPVARWIDEESWNAFNELDGHSYGCANPESGVTTVELFQRFRVWCKRHGEREGRSEELGRQLVELGWKAFRSPRATGQKPSYRRERKEDG